MEEPQPPEKNLMRGEIIREKREEKKLTQQELADIIGKSRTSIVNYEQGGGLTKSVAKKIAQGLDIPLELLFVPHHGSKVNPIPQQPGRVNRKKEESPNKDKDNLQILVETVDNAGSPNIVLVDSKARGGYIDSSGEIEYIKDLPTFSLPSRILRNGTFRAFEVTGQSMGPKFPQGNLIIGQFLTDWVDSVKDGRLYIVVLDDDIVFKRVINRIAERGQLFLKSDNYQFQDYPVAAEKVKEVWEYKANINFDGSNPFFDLFGWVQKLENKIYDLEDQIKPQKP